MLYNCVSITKSSILNNCWRIHIRDMFSPYGCLYFWFTFGKRIIINLFAIERQSPGTRLCRRIFLPKPLEYKDFSLFSELKKKIKQKRTKGKRPEYEFFHIVTVWKQNFISNISLKEQYLLYIFHCIWSIYIVLNVSVEFYHLQPLIFPNIWFTVLKRLTSEIQNL